MIPEYPYRLLLWHSRQDFANYKLSRRQHSVKEEP
jgi:hypothetical protein